MAVVKTLFRGEFEDKIREEMKNFEGIQELLNLLYKGNLEEEKDFSFYDEENNVTYFATYFPKEVVDGEEKKHQVIVANFKSKLDFDSPEELFETRRISEVVLMPKRAYITTKYPSDEANMVAVYYAYETEDENCKKIAI